MTRYSVFFTFFLSLHPASVRNHPRDSFFLSLTILFLKLRTCRGGGDILECSSLEKYMNPFNFDLQEGKKVFKKNGAVGTDRLSWGEKILLHLFWAIWPGTSLVGQDAKGKLTSPEINIKILFFFLKKAYCGHKLWDGVEPLIKGLVAIYLKF